MPHVSQIVMQAATLNGKFGKLKLSAWNDLGSRKPLANGA
jgi:hypothetical protein